MFSGTALSSLSSSPSLSSLCNIAISSALGMKDDDDDARD